MGSRIVLDYDNEQIINKISMEMEKSPSAVVNSILRRIEIVIPNKKKVELEVDDMDINKVKKTDKRN